MYSTNTKNKKIKCNWWKNLEELKQFFKELNEWEKESQKINFICSGEPTPPHIVKIIDKHFWELS